MAASAVAAAPTAAPAGRRVVRWWRLAPDLPVSRSRRLVALDVAVAVAAASVALGTSGHLPTPWSGPLAERVAVVCWFAATSGRRFAPGTALWVAAAGTVVATAGANPVTSASLATALCTALVVQSRSLLVALAVSVVPLGVVGLAMAGSLAADPGQLVVATAAHALAWVLGVTGRARRLAESALAERRASELLAAERDRIARELHDAVGHAVTVMTTHAGALRLSMARAPSPAGSPEVQEVLTTIEGAGRAAMDDLDRVLGLLDDDAATDGHPWTDDVTTELRAVAAAVPGAAVHLDLPDPGALAALTGPARLTVRRVVQESLTNVVRHAGREGGAQAATPVTVQVLVELRGAAAWGHRVSGEVVRVSVQDDGTPGTAGPAAGGPGRTDDPVRQGRGLVGLQRRVTELGGWLRAGPGPADGPASDPASDPVGTQRGWHVLAEIPADPSGASRPPRGGRAP